MGCDIHSRAEVRESGVWRMVRRIWPDEYVDGGLTSEPYFTRNYYTFAILAGVRNYAKVIPIAEPRGWPDDLSAECQQEDDGDDDDAWLLGGEHSFSWHSLRHLLEYPYWQATFTQEGILNGPQYAAMKKGNLPDQWWDSNSRAVVDEDHLETQLALNNDTTNLYVRTSWAVPYYKAAEEFITETIPRLLALASPHPDVLTMANLAIAGEKTALSPLQDWLQEHDRPGLDDVRMVFCFDN
jgi:hypothetical protein